MRRVLVAGLIAILAACGGASGPGAETGPPRSLRGSADLISEAEISAGVYENALEVVRILRPAMMRPRGSTSDGPIPVVLFIDDSRMVDLNGMATIPAHRVKEIRYINARDATTRYGTGVGSGVILVTTKR